MARLEGKVVAADVQFELLQERINEINAKGGDALALKLDVSSANDWTSAIDETRNTPLPPYLGDPKDIAYMVLFLASDESKFATGSEFVVDGGATSK